MQDSFDDIHNRFSYHAPATDLKREQHESVRDGCENVAHYFDHLLPPGREKALAITKLEEAMFWANAALARNL